ncbi:MAG TPA: SusC/RagA family TonB-linked outer membrane protein [Chitinophagaceae bacterium]
MKKLTRLAAWHSQQSRLFTCIFFCVGLLFLPGTHLSAQVSGLVLEKSSGRALEGVSVTIKDEKTGTTTNNMGRFLIKVDNPQKAILVFSLIGYKLIEEPLNGRLVLNLEMEDSSIIMQSVVVTALGFETQRDKLGYSSSKINGEQVANSGEVNLVDAMGGKASGVRISRSSGSDPGSASQILIRGQSTITRGTDPLIVLDGIPINSDSRGESSQGVTQQSRLNDINPDDIASMQVLKGASAAALWGTRAANGVVIITTKKGANNGKLNVSVKTTYSIDDINLNYPLQSSYGQGTNGAWAANNTRSWGDKIANRAGGLDLVNTGADYFVGYPTGTIYYPILTKNNKEIFLDKNYNSVFQKGHYLNTSLSVSGGDAKSNYFLSLGDMNQQGTIRNNSDYRRTTFRVNASRQLNKWLKVSNKASYVLTNSDRVRRGSSSGGVMLGLLRTPPDFDNTDYVGSYYSSPTAAFVSNRQRAYRSYLGTATPGFSNPLWTIYKQDNSNNVNRFINSAEIFITPTKWLDVTVRAGLDNFTEREITYLPYYTINAASGLYSRDEFNQTQFNLDFIARAGKDFGAHIKTNILFGFNYNSSNEGLLSANGTNFIIPDGPRDIDNSLIVNRTISDRFEKTRTDAGYATLGAELYDQVFINLTGRLEAASTFGELSKSSFFYPSADIAWQFSHLPVFTNSNIFSFGKLRLSYGMVGIQPSAYKTSTNFFVPNWAELLDPNLDGSLFGTGTYVQSRVKGNPYLRPEKKREFEIGTDLRFLDNKIAFSTTVYFNKTTDALLDIPQAPATGFTTLYANAGSIQNRGVEIDLSYEILKKKNWLVSLEGNWTKNKNKVTDLNGSASILLGGLNGVSSRAVEGYPLGALWGIGFQKDAKGAYILDANGFPLSEVEQKVLGDPNPDWRSGLGFNVQYKNIKLYALFERSQGGDIVNATEAVLLDYGVSAATGHETNATANLKTASGATIAAGIPFRGNIGNFGGGDVALDQSWYNGLGGFFGNVLEPFVGDATWTRLRELTLSYQITRKHLPKFTGLSSVNIEISGRNLWLNSKLKSIDPDSNLEGSGSGRGIVYFNNPGSKSYLFSLKLNF